METIRNYLDNMFMGLPKTSEVIHLKEELLRSMEDKYNELKTTGKSENEAIGIVISEFGNIEELTAELAIEKETVTPLPEVTQEIAEDFIKIKKKSSWLIAIGVFLCIFGANLLIFNAGSEEGSQPVLGLILLLVLVAIAVGFFIFSGVQLEGYKYLEDDFTMNASVKSYVETKQSAYRTTQLISLISGIILCILSSIAVLVPAMMNASDDLILRGVNLLLLIVSVGAFLIVFSSVRQEAYNILLKKEDYTPQKKASDKIVGTIAGIYWPVIVCAYLLWSFLTGNWQFTWIIWPIAGILFGAAASIIESTYKPK